MTRDDILRMAREAGLSLKSFAEPPKPYIHVSGYDDTLERFANLVAAAAKAEEREACAQIVEREAMTYADPVWAVEIVNDIRARDPNYVAPKPEPFDPVAHREMIDKVTKAALKILDAELAKQGKQ